LFIGAGVEVSNLAGEFGGDDAVGSNESVREGRFSMILCKMLVHYQYCSCRRSVLTTWAKIQILNPVSNSRNVPHHGGTYISDAVWVALESDQLFWVDDRHFGYDASCYSGRYSREDVVVEIYIVGINRDVNFLPTCLSCVTVSRIAKRMKTTPLQGLTART
jgi:hypothetical protein